MHRSPHRRSTRIPIVLAGLSLATLTACSEHPLLPSDRVTPEVARSLVASVDQARMDAITRSVALALGNQGLRNQVKNDLRDSRHTIEHKLELRSYLKGQSGGPLLAQMAHSSGLSRDSLLALLSGGPPLEFYMPVDAHRESWTGGSDLLVSWQLSEESAPIGYTLAGERTTLSLTTAPDTPTLTLVPSETDFEKPLDAAKIRNTNDRGGQAIGTYGAACAGSDPACAGETAALVGGPDAVYLTQMFLSQLHEPWPKGDPEIEVHVHGPRSKEQPLYGEDLTCAGERAVGESWFNQDANHWSGRALLMNRYEINKFQAEFPGSAMHYLVWEDDYLACQTVTDRDMKQTLLNSAAVGVGVGIKVWRSTGAPPAAIKAAAVAFVVDLIRNASSWMYGNDDFVGVLVDIAGSGWESYAPNATHVLMFEGMKQGSARLEFVWPSTDDGRSFMSSATPSVSSIAIDMTQTASLGATMRDQYGSWMNHPFSWRTDNRWVAKVADNGTVTPVTPGNATIFLRACDPGCIDSPVTVAVTGPVMSHPDYAYSTNALFRSTIVNPRESSYYYYWEYQQCTRTSCTSMGYGGEGWNRTNFDVFVSAMNTHVTVRLTVKAPDMRVIGTAVGTVYGAGESSDPNCSTKLACEAY